MGYLCKHLLEAKELGENQSVILGTSFTFGYFRPETIPMNSRNAIIYNMHKIGFPIVAMNEVYISQNAVQKIYTEWWGKEDRDARLTKYLQSTTVLAFLARDVLSFATISPEGIIKPNRYSYTGPQRFKYLCGSTGENVLGAGLRGIFGLSPLQTAIHRSDDELKALTECLAVSPELVEQVLSGHAVNSRIDSYVIDTVNGLMQKEYNKPNLFDTYLFWASTTDAMNHFLFRNNFYS